MPNERSREALALAIDEAIAIFANETVDPGELADYHLPENLAAEMQLGMSKIPISLLPGDLTAYILSLMATKVIAAGSVNSDREGALRLLYAAAGELASRRFSDDGEWLIDCNADDQLQPWPDYDEMPPPVLPETINHQPDPPTSDIQKGN